MDRVAMPEQLRAAGVTARELDTFWLVADRLQNREIADRLHLSERTVESHISSLLRKLGGTNRLSLVAVADNLRDQLERRVTGLPMPLSSFVGRAEQLDELAGLVTRHRLVTLTGPAGAGKTRLALQLARTTDGLPPAVLVDLASLPPGSAVERAFTDVLGLDLDGRPPRTVLRDVLSRGEHWLVVDNCEHVSDEVAALLVMLLSGAPGVRVLATSHGPLRVAGEVVYEVPPLDLPPAESDGLDQLAAAEAVRLFVDRAAAAAPGFALSVENAGDIASVCHRLDGLPLAIELAAARVRTFSPAELLARLDDRFAILTDGAQGTETRHRTLEQALRWSYDLLDHDERVVLERCSVFPGLFDYDTAASIVCYPPLTSAGFDRAFPRVLDRSLVVSRRRGQATEYRLLDSVRQFAHRQLVANADVTALRERYGQHVLDYGVGLVDALRGRDQPAALAWYARRWGDVAAAMRWAFERDDHELAWSFIAGVGTAWEIVGVHGELFDWLNALLERPLPVGELGIEAAMTATVVLCQVDAARAMEMAERADLEASRPFALLARGWAAGHGGQAARIAAREHLREAAGLFRQAGDRWHQAFALSGCAGVEDDPEVAIACATESVELFGRCGDVVKQANVLYHLASRAMEWNVHLDEVGRWIADARTLAARTGNRHEILHVRVVAATYAQLRGELAVAEEGFRELLGEYRRIDDRRCVARCLRGLAFAALRKGDLGTARHQLREAIRLAVETGPRRRVEDGLKLLADVETAGGRPDLAERVLKAGALQDPTVELEAILG